MTTDQAYAKIEKWFGNNHPLQTQMLAMLLDEKKEGLMWVGIRLYGNDVHALSFDNEEEYDEWSTEMCFDDRDWQELKYTGDNKEQALSEAIEYFRKN